MHTHKHTVLISSSKCEEKAEQRNHFVFPFFLESGNKKIRTGVNVKHSYDMESNGSHNKLQRLNVNTQNVTQFSSFPRILF